MMRLAMRNLEFMRRHRISNPVRRPRSAGERGEAEHQRGLLAGEIGRHPDEVLDGLLAEILRELLGSVRGVAHETGKQRRVLVEALGGAPGIFSARWAGPERDFRVAMEKVNQGLVACGATAPEARRAHFVAALCVAWPDGHVEEFEGRVDGTLIWPPRGDKGFGYDPMFLPDGEKLTFGEMMSVEKHRLPPAGRGLSHRARAFLLLAEACLGKG